MTTEDRIFFCKQCKKRGFNPKSGITCSLTNEKPTFDIECNDFEKDAKVDPTPTYTTYDGQTGAEAMQSQSPWKIFLGVLVFIIAIARILRLMGAF